MSIEQEALKQAYDEKQEAKAIFEDMEAEQGTPAVDDVADGLKIDFSFLMAKTGQGSISEYIDHPLNRKQSEGMAQALRGFTGMFGALDYAVVDIVIGGFKVMQENKRAGNAD